MQFSFIHSCNVVQPKGLPLEKNRKLQSVGSCDCQPNLLPRVFQVLPTTCNESEEEKEMNSNTESKSKRCLENGKMRKWGPREMRDGGFFSRKTCIEARHMASLCMERPAPTPFTIQMGVWHGGCLVA